jgi:hypothetical protein
MLPMICKLPMICNSSKGSYTNFLNLIARAHELESNSTERTKNLGLSQQSTRKKDIIAKFNQFLRTPNSPISAKHTKK